jgi:hypothetical protein
MKSPNNKYNKKKATSDFEIGLIAINSPGAETVLSEVFKSLEEAIGEIGGHV